ncbi:hypothetical protein CHX27_09880 [Flavobacterium aurantiibacter]|uniref:Uncharacterized protein n=1 Tax=Flavobacterium aurantiibacter TaxID=2023067 RepID=A0A255ZQ46_9FLAO|nr:hypothetical protein CHX27_09880 [Flavobacterium aurantiibacter]
MVDKPYYEFYFLIEFKLWVYKSKKLMIRMQFPPNVGNVFRSSGRADYPTALRPGFGCRARSMSDDAAPRYTNVTYGRFFVGAAQIMKKKPPIEVVF